MLARSLTSILLLIWSVSALSLPPNGQSLSSTLSPNLNSSAIVNGSDLTTGEYCFDPSLEPRLQPASFQDCLEAVKGVLQGVERPERRVYFARTGRATYKLPVNFRSATCVISLDVTNDDDRDQFQPIIVYDVAMMLISQCVESPYYRLGGKRTVGPKSLVNLMVFGRKWPPTAGEGSVDETLGLGMANTTSVVARDAEDVVSRAVNASSVGLTGLPTLNTSDVSVRPHCFQRSAFGRSRVPVNEVDCFRAATNIIKNIPWNSPMTFSRKSGAQIDLPSGERYGSCDIEVDIVNETEEDTFELWTLYGAILDVALACTASTSQGVYIWGGTRLVGPKSMVTIQIMGTLAPPGGIPTLVLPDSAPDLTLTQVQSGMSNLSNTSHLSTNNSSIDILASNSSSLSPNESSVASALNLGGIPECYDPPLPRERAYPINLAECEEATIQIIGDRIKWQPYIFSRKQVPDPFYYPLPARFEYHDCVAVVDMDNDTDEDRVRLAFVEASAWVLAERCSGEENPESKYGGTMTVGMGSNDLIHVYVYGRHWPTNGGGDLVSAPPQNTSVVDTQ